MTVDAKTERPAVPIRPPLVRDEAGGFDLVAVPARPVQHKPVPSLREIQKEVADLRAHLDHIIGQLKALSDSLNAALNG